MDFVNLSPKQKMVANYLYAHRGRIITFNELLSECWREYDEPEFQQDRTLVQKVVSRIRKKLGGNCILTSRDRNGYIWIGNGVNTHKNVGGEKIGYDIKETILASDRAIDGAVTIARMVINGDGFILQLQQSKGSRAQTVNLDSSEWDNLVNFVTLTSVIDLE